MTQAFLNSVRKLNFYHFKSKYISQSDSMGEFLKKLTVDDFGSIPESSCMDFDNELNLLAIGNKKGVVKIFGRPGVTFSGHLEAADEIWNVKFITGSNFLITLTSENKLTLWLILSSSKELLKIDTISNLTNLSGHLDIQKLIHADGNNNSEIASSLNITAIEFIDITSSIIMGNGEGSLVQVKVDLLKMCKHKENVSANQSVVASNSLWQHPSETDVITKDRIIKKLPVGSQSRVELEAIIHISARPGSRRQLLIGFNSGHSVIYDLQQDTVVFLLSSPGILTELCWCPPNPIVQDSFFVSPTNSRPQYQLSNNIFSCHDDGSIMHWSLPTPESAFLAINSDPIFPYGGDQKCLTVSKILWKKHHRGDILIFSGGLPRADYMTKSTITVMLKNCLNASETSNVSDANHVVFDLTSQLIDFRTIEDPETNYSQYIMVLTEEEFFIINLLSNDWPIMYNEQPYLNCLHHSPITAYHFMTNVSRECFTKLKDMNNRVSFAVPNYFDWPIKGDLQKKPASPIDLWQNDLMMTGHGDGSVVFWRLGLGGCLEKLTTINSSQFFKSHEEPNPGYREYEDEVIPFRKAGVFDPCCDDNRFAIQIIHFTGRNLLIGGCGGQVIMWGFVNESYKAQTVEIDLTTHLPNFHWKGCQPLEHVEVKGERSKSSFSPIMIVSIFPPSQITALDLFDNEDQLLAAFGTLHGLGVVSCSETVDDTACVLTTHCTVPRGGAASQEAALGEGWARRRTRELKKSLRNSFRRLRRKSTRRIERPSVKRNLSSNVGSDGLQVELVENEVDFEERVVEDRPKDTANNGLIRSIKLSISCLTKKSSTPGTERFLNLFAGSSGGLLLWFQTHSKLNAHQPSNNLKLRLIKQYQLQHCAPVLFLNLVGQDHNKLGSDQNDERLDQLLVVTEEQVRLYSLPTFSLKSKLRVTAHDGFRLKNAHIVVLQDEKSSTNRLTKETFISITNNGGQIFLLNTLTLKRKDVIQVIDKTDLMALNFMCLARCIYNGPKAVTPYGIHYSGHGQITLFEIIPKSRNGGFISSGYNKK